MYAGVWTVCAFAITLTGCGRLWFDPVDDAAVSCRSGYAALDGSCYRFVINPVPELSWTAAELACEGDGAGAHLIVIDDDAERAIASSALVGSSNAWIGASDRIAEGSYVTVTGQPAVVVWSPGEPTGAAEDCVQIMDTGALGDRDCTNLNDYLCEADGRAVDASSF